MALSTTVRRERERANERDANAKMREDALSVPRRTDGGRATTQMARDADSFFRDVFRDADDVRTRSRAWGGRGRRTREGSSVRRLVSTRLVSSRARARSDARYFLSRKKLDQKGHQNDLMTLLISSGTRVEMD